MIEYLRFVERYVVNDANPSISSTKRILQMKVNGQWIDAPMGGEGE